MERLFGQNGRRHFPERKSKKVVWEYTLHSYEEQTKLVIKTDVEHSRLRDAEFLFH